MLILADAAERASRYLSRLAERRVYPAWDAIDGLEALGGSLQESGCDPVSVLESLDVVGSPATVASAGGRYFGFVTGGALPAALAANWLAGAWDQNASLTVMSPVAAKLESVALGWLRELFGLPPSAAGALVTGATMANFTCVAAARHALLRRAGWNVEDDGLFGAPPLRVVVSAEVHVSMRKALSLAGLGRTRVTEVPTDAQGRMRADELPALDGRTLVCVQAGNVNTGAFDPAGEICDRARAAGAWVHVDGAFGLWASAAPGRRQLVRGVEHADSWATDCHKWLNAPYDSGVSFVRDGRDLAGAMTATAVYLQQDAAREPCHLTPEMSRRARGADVWAALKSLGRAGVAEIVERNCRQAAYAADRFRRAGLVVLNDVVLNQVLVTFGDAGTTRRTIAAIQADGTCWCGGTEWQGRTAMRLSVSSWATTDADIESSVDAILRIAHMIRNCGSVSDQAASRADAFEGGGGDSADR